MPHYCGTCIYFLLLELRLLDHTPGKSYHSLGSMASRLIVRCRSVVVVALKTKIFGLE